MLKAAARGQLAIPASSRLCGIETRDTPPSLPVPGCPTHSGQAPRPPAWRRLAAWRTLRFPSCPPRHPPTQDMPRLHSGAARATPIARNDRGLLRLPLPGNTPIEKGPRGDGGRRVFGVWADIAAKRREADRSAPVWRQSHSEQRPRFDPGSARLTERRLAAWRTMRFLASTPLPPAPPARSE